MTRQAPNVHKAIKWHGAWYGVPGVDVPEIETRPNVISWFDIEDPDGNEMRWYQVVTSAPFPKFVIHRSIPCHELRKQRGTSNSMILVPLFDLKFLNEFAASGAGTSNRRH